MILIRYGLFGVCRVLNLMVGPLDLCTETSFSMDWFWPGKGEIDLVTIGGRG